MNDQNCVIEKQVLDGQAKLQKSALLLKKNNINLNPKMSDMNASMYQMPSGRGDQVSIVSGPGTMSNFPRQFNIPLKNINN